MEIACKKIILENFAKFTGKFLSFSNLSNKLFFKVRSAWQLNAKALFSRDQRKDGL